MTGPLDTGVYQVQYQAAGTFSWVNGPSIPYITPSNGSMVDASGVTWTISAAPAAQMVHNGVVDSPTNSVVIAFLTPGSPQKIWQMNTGGNWYYQNIPWVSGAWVAAGTTSPLTTPGVPINNLNPGTTYNIQVYATSTQGVGATSAVIQASTAAATPSSIMRAADFIAGLGVDVHISQGTASYGNASAVIADLQYLGVWNLRDSCNNSWQSVYAAVGQAGGKFCFVSAVGGAWSTGWITQFLSYVTAVATAAPGSVLAVEGPNEINNWPGTWTNGDTGINAAVDFQQNLYTQAKALSYQPLVFYFTGYNAGGIPIGPNPATTPGLADYDTQHPYPNSNQPPLAWVNRTQALGNETPATGPAVYTETGYQTPPTADIARTSYTLDLLMDTAKQGIFRTYLYELMDEGDGWGLFDTNNNPTAVATAIHNLTTILADTSANAQTFTISPVTYTVSNLPANGYSLAFQKADGTTFVAVWIESATVPGPNTTVGVNFTGPNKPTIHVYDPLVGTAAIATLTNAATATIQVTDHPILVSVP